MRRSLPGNPSMLRVPNFLGISRLHSVDPSAASHPKTEFSEPTTLLICFLVLEIFSSVKAMIRRVTEDLNTHYRNERMPSTNQPCNAIFPNTIDFHESAECTYSGEIL